MSGIKYYRLMAGDELPDEFCVVRDVNGEPEEYTWYEPVDSFDRELWGIFKKSDWVAASEYRKLKTENAKLRELLVEVLHELDKAEPDVTHGWFWEAARELGVECELDGLQARAVSTV